jgi:hypothetical protein
MTHGGTGKLPAHAVSSAGILEDAMRVAKIAPPTRSRKIIAVTLAVSRRERRSSCPTDISRERRATRAMISAASAPTAPDSVAVNTPP